MKLSKNISVPSVSLASLSSLVMVSLLFAPAALAERYRVFEDPHIGRLWVDGCIMEYGEVNCSQWAKSEAANAFCRIKGYSQVHGTWYTRDEGSGHSTYRYTILRRNGVEVVEWRLCTGCSFRITQIECVSY